jgi:hypothetical protein
MWDPKNDSTADLLAFLERRPLDRMEKGFQDAARHELKRREEEAKNIQRPALET